MFISVVSLEVVRRWNVSVSVAPPPALPPSVPASAWPADAQVDVDVLRARDRPVGVVAPDVRLVLDRDARLGADAVVDAVELVVEPAVQRVDPHGAARLERVARGPRAAATSSRGRCWPSARPTTAPTWSMRTLSSWKPWMMNTDALTLVASLLWSRSRQNWLMSPCASPSPLRTFASSLNGAQQRLAERAALRQGHAGRRARAGRDAGVVRGSPGSSCCGGRRRCASSCTKRRSPRSGTIVLRPSTPVAATPLDSVPS